MKKQKIKTFAQYMKEEAKQLAEQEFAKAKGIIAPFESCNRHFCEPVPFDARKFGIGRPITPKPELKTADEIIQEELAKPDRPILGQQRKYVFKQVSPKRLYQISPAVLITFYNRMKNEPDKIFIKSDFKVSCPRAYLRVLYLLDVIDVVKTRNKRSQAVIDGFILKNYKERQELEHQRQELEHQRQEIQKLELDELRESSLSAPREIAKNAIAKKDAARMRTEELREAIDLAFKDVKPRKMSRLRTRLCEFCHQTIWSQWYEGKQVCDKCYAEIVALNAVKSIKNGEDDE